MMRARAAANKLLVLTASAACSLAAWVVTPASTETAVANGDTRTIHFYHTHTGESIDATFRVDGRYDPAVLDRLNTFLRDWRNNDQTRMDPRLFDTLWEVYRQAGAGDTPIQIYSAYRSPETNAMLRRRSRAVAEHSQHMLGKAMDTTMPGMSMERIREIGMKLQRGGVGYYQSANFVHLDVGGVRSWPRMGYDQLARLFPDGKTVHIPSNGQPMARYEEARAELASRGDSEVPPAQQSQGFFAWLFSGQDTGGSQGNTVVATRQAPVGALAYNPEGDEGGVANGALRQRAAPAPVPAPAPVQAAVPAPQAVPVPERRPDPVAVASLRPDGADPRPTVAAVNEADAAPSGFDGVIPIPPRRPAMPVTTVADLPIPPVRLDSSFRVQIASADDTAVPLPMARPTAMPDPIGGLISTSSGMHALRKTTLPAIITQGTERKTLPGPALAFAATETSEVPRATPRGSVTRAAAPVVRGLALRAVTALRGEHTAEKPATIAANVVSPVSAPAALDGPSIFGLRRAARSIATPL